MSPLIDFETLIRPSKPNTYLLAPEGLCQQAKVDLSSPRFAMSAEVLFDRALALIDQTPRWALGCVDNETLQLAFTARTKLLGFTDDIDLQALAAAQTGQSEIAIYSRSRVGYSDLGANRKRVTEIIRKLTSF